MGAPRSFVLRVGIFAGAAIMIAVGAFIFATSDEVLGAILAGVGVIDLLTAPLVLRSIERRERATNPDANPYARED